jgi:hypothetical protein
LVSQLRENLLLCSSHRPLGVPNWFVNTDTSTSFLAPLPGIEEEEAPTSTTRQQNITSFLALLPGRKRISARGVFRFQSFYFVIILRIFFTLFLFASFHQNYKKLVSLIVGIVLLLLLVHYVDPRVCSERPINR